MNALQTRPTPPPPAAHHQGAAERERSAAARAVDPTARLIHNALADLHERAAHANDPA